MKALSITHESITRKSLLQIAERIPGAWVGIRIAAYLLILSGWKSSQVAFLFGLTRWSVVKWIQKANQEGLEAVKEKLRPGRPSQLNEACKKALEEALSKSPKEFGMDRARWDGIVVVEYLKRFHKIKIHVRHAQRWIRKLGYSLRRPMYRFVQASEEGIEEFREIIKKTSPAPKRQQKTKDSF